jgi:hypothetical protein
VFEIRPNAGRITSGFVFGLADDPDVGQLRLCAIVVL